MENKYVVVNCCDVLSCIPVTTRLSLSSSPDLGVHVRVEESSKLTSKRLHTLGVNTARVRKSCDGFGVQRWTHYTSQPKDEKGKKKKSSLSPTLGS